VSKGGSTLVLRATPDDEELLGRLRRLPVPAKGVLLSSTMFLLLSTNFAATRWSATTWEEVLVRVAAGIVSAIVAALIVSRAEGRPIGLSAALFTIVYGTMYLLPATETFYLGSTLPYSQALGMVVWGALTVAVFSVVATALFGPEPRGSPTSSGLRLVMPAREWVWKLLVLAGIWTALFILFGVTVYQPIAKTFDPTGYAAEVAKVTNGGVALLSQPFWAVAWIALAVPILRSLKTNPATTSLALAGLLGGFMGVDMLLATNMGFWLQLGHFLESVGESTVFGLSVVWILQRGGRLSTPGGKPSPEPVGAGRRAIA